MRPRIGPATAKARKAIIELIDNTVERFFASAIPAFLRETKDIQVIESGEIVVLEPDATIVWNGAAAPVARDITRVEMDEDAAEKGGHETFMLKEIHEQPAALWDTLGDRLNPDGTVDLPDLGLDDAELARLRPAAAARAREFGRGQRAEQ